MTAPGTSPASVSGDLVLVALGSNLGDSPSLLRAAVTRLRLFAIHNFRASSIWESEPVDCPPGSPNFFNAAVAFHLVEGLTPETLLKALQTLEKEFGRQKKTVLNEARPLDLDLIAFGRETRQSSELVLPHPRAHLRGFVLQPLRELAPDLQLPGQERTIAELAGMCGAVGLRPLGPF